MTSVQTVLGAIDVSEMGPTLVHEHFYISYPGDALDPNDTFDRKSCIETGMERVGQTQAFGIKTWVDPCPIDLGRDPEMMAEISQATGIKIVCTTGFYQSHIGLPYYWRLRS